MPGVAISVACVLVVLSIVVLVIYVDHTGKSLRVSSLIELVGDATRTTLDDRYPDRGVAEASSDASDVAAPHSGVISRLDESELAGVAESADVVIELMAGLGAFVPRAARS